MSILTERPVAYFLIGHLSLLALLGVVAAEGQAWPYASRMDDVRGAVQFIAMLVIAACLVLFAAGGKRLKGITAIGCAGIASLLCTTDGTALILGLATVAAVLIAEAFPDGFL